MNILILQGSPRANGNTAWMAEEYRKAAEAAGHKVTLVDVSHKKIAGCMACEYCHGKGNGAGQQSARRRTGASALSCDLPAGDLLAVCRLHDPLAVAVVHDLAAVVDRDSSRTRFAEGRHAPRPREVRRPRRRLGQREKITEP